MSTEGLLMQVDGISSLPQTLRRLAKITPSSKSKAPFGLQSHVIDINWLLLSSTTLYSVLYLVFINLRLICLSLVYWGSWNSQRSSLLHFRAVPFYDKVLSPVILDSCDSTFLNLAFSQRTSFHYSVIGS
ncbi:hypothetical protein BJY00DRAFT_18043 [Aspergillus carlsbadensis]|nr:hypothetical protein BJY00DRAFT_18043 [Aspergillus carlsbadensis]